ncbi:GntR family transcriptional regulator [Priestia aryabhattai]|uniref:GntR family transcriptional regulator n=1 Tax=Priestia aryabhattai TaxID=412384 RepID=UPI003D27424E
MWGNGRQILSETKLMHQFEVSRNTLRKAIQSVVHTGRLQTKQGKAYEKADIQLHKTMLEALHKSYVN